MFIISSPKHITAFTALILIGSAELCAAPVTWEAPVSINAVISVVTSINIGDFNNDGLNDIAVFEGGKHGNKPMCSWFQAPDWVQREFIPGFTPGPFIGDSELADINGDGFLDVVFPEDGHSTTAVPANLYWLIRLQPRRRHIRLGRDGGVRHRHARRRQGRCLHHGRRNRLARDSRK